MSEFFKRRMKSLPSNHGEFFGVSSVHTWSILYMEVIVSGKLTLEISSEIS